MHRGRRVGALAFVLALAGCGASGGGHSSPRSEPASRPAPRPASTRSGTPATTPVPSAPASSAPLSPFEADPGVVALRRWAVVAAQTVNSGHYTGPALAALMTAAGRAELQQSLGGDVGLHYPGPLPFLPESVQVQPASRTIRICVVGAGFAQAPGTSRPAKPLYQFIDNVHLVYAAGRWLVDTLYQPATPVPCTTTTVPMPRW